MFSNMCQIGLLKVPKDVVNMRLLPAKLSFLFFFGGLSCLLPFLSVWMYSIGLTSAEIGMISTVRPLMSFIAAPLVTMICDKTKKHRLIFLFCIVSSTLTRFLLLFTKNFWTIFVVSMVSDFLLSPVGGLLNDAVLALLGDQKKAYGKQRLYGAVGWGSFSLVIGILISNFNDYNYAFAIFFITMMVAAFVCLPVINNSSTNKEFKIVSSEEGGEEEEIELSEESKMNSNLNKTPFFESIKLLSSNIETIVIYCIAFIMGMASSINGTYLFLFLKDFGGSETLMGLSLSVTCLAELPFFFYAGELMAKYSSRGLLIASLFCYGIRLLYYTFLPNAWAVLPAELLHGITFAAFWSASVSIIADNSPRNLSATAQGLLSGVYEGLGTGCGTLFGGLMYQSFGPRATFLISSMALFLSWFVFFSYSLYQKHFKKRQLHKQDGIGSYEENVQFNATTVDLENEESFIK